MWNEYKISTSKESNGKKDTNLYSEACNWNEHERVQPMIGLLSKYKEVNLGLDEYNVICEMNTEMSTHVHAHAHAGRDKRVVTRPSDAPL